MDAIIPKQKSNLLWKILDFLAPFIIVGVMWLFVLIRA